jgi:GntR family transcriptional regulator
VTASDKQLASEARRLAVEEDFDKAIDRAVAIGMNKEEILEVVKLILDEK